MWSLTLLRISSLGQGCVARQAPHPLCLEGMWCGARSSLLQACVVVDAAACGRHPSRYLQLGRLDAFRLGTALMSDLHGMSAGRLGLPRLSDRLKNLVGAESGVQRLPEGEVVCYPCLSSSDTLSPLDDNESLTLSRAWPDGDPERIGPCRWCHELAAICRGTPFGEELLGRSGSREHIEDWGWMLRAYYSCQREGQQATFDVLVARVRSMKAVMQPVSSPAKAASSGQGGQRATPKIAKIEPGVRRQAVHASTPSRRTASVGSQGADSRTATRAGAQMTRARSRWPRSAISRSAIKCLRLQHRSSRDGSGM